ncbi:ATP-grasp domain-containing protein [Rhizomonospora bruguierae]|uniref:ATP-grasp domain-containing protein n=1 Tax=Rhizomonospora bruguierae TaxID=1581705 RepID=UPI001BD13458|nr:ATP-grasp domain-containing protein [Micromonospora sp. NBRC 107566]
MTVVDRAQALASPETQRLLGPDVRTVPLADTTLVTSDWYAAAREAVGDQPPEGIVAFSEEHVVAAAMIADEFRRPGPGLRAALTSRDKTLQRAIFERHGIAQPRWHHVHDLDEGARWLSAFGRAVTKPTDRGGSEGVRLVASLEELRTWYGTEQPETFLLEEYVAGPEYSVELLVRAGAPVFVNVTGKRTTGPPHFVEVGHVAPARLAEGDEARMRSAAVAVVDALGMGSGIAHVELRQTDAGPVVMEVAVRTPGDYIMEMVGAAWGVDLFEQVIRVACGRSVEQPARPAAAAEVVFPDADEIAGSRIADPHQPWASGVLLSTVTTASEATGWTDSLSRGGALVHVAADHEALVDNRRRLFPAPSDEFDATLAGEVPA